MNAKPLEVGNFILENFSRNDSVFEISSIAQLAHNRVKSKSKVNDQFRQHLPEKLKTRSVILWNEVWSKMDKIERINFMKGVTGSDIDRMNNATSRKVKDLGMGTIKEPSSTIGALNRKHR